MGDDNETEDTPEQGRPAAGPLYGQFGQVVPGPTVTTTGPKRTKATVEPTAGYMQSMGRQEAAFDREASGMQDAANAEIETAKQQKLVFDNELNNEYARQAARAKAAQEWNDRIAKAREQLDQRIAQASQEPTSYWADRTEGEKTRARIGMWLSAFGAGISGGDNLAIKGINDAIERDLKVKQAKSERMFKLAEQSRGLLSDAYRMKAEELGDMDAQRVAAWQVVEKEMKSIEMGMLPASKRAEVEQKVAQVQQKQAQAAQDANKNLEAKVTNEDQYVTTTLPADGKAKAAPVYDPKTGKPIAMAPAAAAKDLNDQGEKAQGALDALEEMLRIEEEKVWGIPSNLVPVGEIAHRREQAANNVAVAFKRLEGTNLGRGLTPETRKLIEEVTGASGETHLRNKADEIQRAMEVILSNLANAYKVKGIGEVAPKAEKGKPEAKAVTKQHPKPAASSVQADHDFIAGKLNRDPDALDAQQTKVFEEAREALRSNDPKKRERAERALKYLRNELPKD